MKKSSIISILFIIIISCLITASKAVSATTLPNDIYLLGKKYKITEADKLRGDRYLKDNPITDEQANAIYQKVLEADKLLEEAGITDIKKLETQLNRNQKLEVERVCQEAAEIIGLKLLYKNGIVEVYKDGKKIDTYTFLDQKLSYTGNNNLVIIISSVLIVLALSTASIVILKKKAANE